MKWSRNCSPCAPTSDLRMRRKVYALRMKHKVFLYMCLKNETQGMCLDE
jgi:hypothetical protein